MAKAVLNHIYAFLRSKKSNRGPAIFIGRRGLAIGCTGMFPGGLAADLARCPVFFKFIFCLPNVPK